MPTFITGSIAYDNIMDFPDTTQSIRAKGESAFTEFGARWFVLPNPMYGSWQAQ